MQSGFGLVGAVFGLVPALLLGCSASEALESSTVALRAPSDHACARCHAEIAREWASSQHHLSDDPLFHAALARENALAFCVGCHAPQAQTALTAKLATGVGVSCNSCHTQIELGPFGHAHSAPSASTACARCHEFDFPGPRPHSEKLQLTLSEESASSFAGTACSSCHMPSVGTGASRHRSHAFAQARDDESLRAALDVEAQRLSPTRVRLTLRSRRVGHSFPTGDLFRRIVVEAEVIGPDFAMLASARRELARHFADVPSTPHGLVRTAASDDRVLADSARVVELELGEPAHARPIVWRVRYERVLHLNPTHESDAVVDSAVLLAAGTSLEKP